MKQLLVALTGLCLLSASARAQDSCAPSGVTNLTASSYWASILLTWTPTGDDCATGNASSFEVRISTSNITDTNWQSVSTVLCSGPTSAFGGADCCVKDVIPCATTTYYFAIFMFDDVGNRSPISNVVFQSARCSGAHTVANCP